MLLGGLPPEILRQLWPHLELVPLQPKRVLHYPDTAMDDIYFVETGLISVVAQSGERKGAEVWLIGREGFLGVPIILGERHPPHRRVVQVAGTAFRMPADALVDAMDEFRPLRRLLLYYVQTVLAQAAQLGACNTAHDVQQRMARWLLMAQDRCTDCLPITHGMLARMLGVRRATVSDCLMALEREGILVKSRSLIKILDRDKLKSMSCICYPIVREADRRLRHKCDRAPKNDRLIPTIRSATL